MQNLNKETKIVFLKSSILFNIEMIDHQKSFMLHPGSIIVNLLRLVYHAVISVVWKVNTFFKALGEGVYCIYIFITVHRQIYQSKEAGKPALTLLLRFMNEYCRRSPDYGVFRFRLFFKPVYVFFKPETIEVILSDTDMYHKDFIYDKLRPFIGTGLITSTGSKWKCRRKMLTPAFHFKILQDFFPTILQSSRVLVKKIENVLDKPWVDIAELALDSSLDVICRTSMNTAIDFTNNDHLDYRKAVHQLSAGVLHRIVRPWLAPDFIFYNTGYGRQFHRNTLKMKEFTRKLIREKKAEMLAKLSTTTTEGSEDPLTKKKVFVDILLDIHLRDPSFTEEDVGEEVDTFVMAGFHTTGMATTWALFLIGHNSNIQRKIHEELDTIFADDHDREIQWEDLFCMKYLECVIKETLRLYPVVPFFGRTAQKDFKVFGCHIPKGTFCAPNPYLLHRNEEIFPDPEKFDPERFFPENCKGRHPFAYIPFAAGQRNCIGQRFGLLELKIVLSNILRNFTVTSLDPRDKVNVVPGIVLMNASPVRIRFERRR